MVNLDTTYFLSEPKWFKNSSPDRWKNTFIFLKLNPNPKPHANYSIEEIKNHLETLK